MIGHQMTVTLRAVLPLAHRRRERRNMLRAGARLVGAGVSWASPFGAVTVDYAVPLTKAVDDVVQPLRFSAGGF
jgi:outer membrane protein assembly factor BamA